MRVSSCRETLGAFSPIHNLGLIDLVARVVRRGQAGRIPHRAVHIDHLPAITANEMMMIVVNPVFVSRGRPGGLDAPDETLVHQDAEGIVYRLARNHANLDSYDLGDFIRCPVWVNRHRTHNGQALGRSLDTVFTKKRGWIVDHGRKVYLILDSVKNYN